MRHLVKIKADSIPPAAPFRGRHSRSFPSISPYSLSSPPLHQASSCPSLRPWIFSGFFFFPLPASSVSCVLCHICIQFLSSAHVQTIWAWTVRLFLNSLPWHIRSDLLFLFTSSENLDIFHSARVFCLNVVFNLMCTINVLLYNCEYQVRFFFIICSEVRHKAKSLI